MYLVPVYVFVGEPVPVSPKHVCKTFRANTRTADSGGMNIKSCLALEFHHILKLSHFEATPCFLHFHRTKVPMSTPFVGDIIEI